MVAQPGKYQASNNSGELALELNGRTDIKQFYAGLSYALNVEPVPQGGSRLSPRSRFIGRIRRKLVSIAGSVTLDLGPHAGEAVLAQSTFPASTLSVIRTPVIVAFAATGNILQFEYRDVDAVWHALGDPFGAVTRAKTRIAATPPGAPVTATGVRLRLTEAPDSPATFVIDTIEALREGGDNSAVRLRPFTFDEDEAYVFVMTDNHADIWRDGVFAAGARHTLGETEIAEADTPQRFDTMLLFHPDQRSHRIMRDGSDGRWPTDAIPFAAVPQVDLGGDYNNAVVDEWELRLTYPTSGTYADGANLLFRLTIDGEDTAAVPVGSPPDWPTATGLLVAAIEALPSMTAGITCTAVTSSGLTVFTLRFTGAQNAGHFSVSGAVTNTSSGALVASNTTIGKAGGEPLISDDAGYAACGTFYQDRLASGGFKSKRGALCASITGEYYNLNIEQRAASGAILVNLDTDGAEKIRRLARSRHLVIFTSAGEYFVSDRALSASSAPNIVNSSSNGIAAGVPVVESEGALLYVSENRALLYAATYDDVAQAYPSEPISLLASHIVNEIADAALQRASTATDARRYWAVRDNGTMVLGTLIRGQDVVAFTRWATDGVVKSVCVDGRNRPHIAVEREVDGETELHLERLELGLLFDGTVEQTFDDPATEVPNLDMHEGAEVWAEADGYIVGPFTVTDGKITLATPASHVSVGRWTPPVAKTLPLPREVAERVVLRRPARVHTVGLDLIGTTSVAIGANNLPARDVPLYFGGQPTDAPPPAFTGLRKAEGLTGFSDEGIVEITQTRPGRLQWRAITVEARI